MTSAEAEALRAKALRHLADQLGIDVEALPPVPFMWHPAEAERAWLAERAAEVAPGITDWLTEDVLRPRLRELGITRPENYVVTYDTSTVRAGCGAVPDRLPDA